MKKLLVTVVGFLPMFAFAKDLPSIDVMKKRLDESGITVKENWKPVGEGLQQAIKDGTLYLQPSNVSSTIMISGTDDEVANKFALAGIHCAASSIISIDMGHNKNLINSMMQTFADSLKTYGYKNNTMVWGYNFKTELVKTDNGIIANCSLN